MKLERLSENKIRCILTGSDLSSREIMLPELAYGSPKARALFRDMMDLAAEELGFETDDTPIMVEAVPLENGSLVLTISKVDNPEELDARFSRFSPASEEEAGSDGDGSPQDMPAWPPFSEYEIDEAPAAPDLLFRADPEDMAVFVFSSLSDVAEMSRHLDPDNLCFTSLFKNPRNGHYYLTAFCDHDEPADYTALCRLAAEYCISRKSSGAKQLFCHMKEHYRPILKDHAVHRLRSL